MFTGIVEGMALVADVLEEPPGRRLIVREPTLARESAIGDSIALSGCCLTVVEIVQDRLSFQAGPETLALTTLGRWSPGSKVNFERSLKAGDRMGGHFVTGHVDGLGRVASRRDEKDWSLFRFSTTKELTSLMAPKGSITVDGVSLTLTEVTDDAFGAALIPHTLSVTTLGLLKPGDTVNLETDVLAKYVAAQLAASLGR